MPYLDTLAAGLALLTLTAAQAAPYPTDLVGTWSSKSNQTLTGPGFYNPTEDTLIEPARTGISYSFTSDGHYEEAYYRAIANPTNPQCPSGIMQWQHGTYQFNTNGSLTLVPIAVDGRQLMSTPCNGAKYATYTRYNQSELFKSYSVYTDPYHGIPRLDLYEFNGSPMQPLYLAFSPPQMLPTTTLNPTATSTATASSTGKAKRGIEIDVPDNWKPYIESEQTRNIVHRIDADRLWWIGISMTGIGGLLYFGPRRLGLHS